MAQASKISAVLAALLWLAPAQARETWPTFLVSVATEAKAAGVGPRGLAALEDLNLDCKQTGVSCKAGDSGKAASDVSFAERSGLPASCNRVTQPEFLQPNNYFPKRMLDNLTAQGRALLAKFRADPAMARALVAMERRSGVPAPMLLAIWGRETSFGKAEDGYDAVQALAGLAFAGAEPRRDKMRAHLIAALRMLDRGSVARTTFRSSWAGATGLTQIMPVEYLENGTDGDGDGRIDIWASAADALATTAATLKRLGWNAAYDWGQEVRVPRPGTSNGRFACTLQSSKNRRPLRAWLGTHDVEPLKRPGGAAMTAAETPAYLIMPGGHDGPAFLVSDNFEVLRSYNTSDLYGIFVGTLADRIGCPVGESCSIRSAWPAEKRLESFPYSVANLCRVQVALNTRGFSPGPIDGLIGAQMRVAIGQWQQSTGQTPDCYPTAALLEALK